MFEVWSRHTELIHLLHLGTLDYSTALELQRTLVELRHQQQIGDALLLLEHPAVITLGRNARDNNLLASREQLASRGVEVFETNRGGDITYHGPGQLVGYPIFDLRGFSPRIGAVDYVRRIEEVLIRTCGDLGIVCERQPGFTGVWTQTEPPSPGSSKEPSREGGKKIAAIGIHISRGITSHGFALNVTTDLRDFELIVPCGITDKAVTSIERELDTSTRRMPTVEEVANMVSANFGRVFSQQVLWCETLDVLLKSAPSLINVES